MKSLRRGRSDAARVISGLVLVLLTAGCQSVGYYSQAIRGHLQLVSRAENIQKILNQSDYPAQLRERLELALDLREFAGRELHLPIDGHYLRYADLGRRFAVWNVYAAPEFSMEAKTWWYPFVGRLEYRGYFSEDKARRYAARLEGKGYDVHLGGVQAYSTLGWFRDPLLNTFLFDADLELAEVLFHELAHQKLFVGGDTDFNEAFATAVAEEGVLHWLKARDDQAALTRYREDLRRKEQFVQLVAGARHRLETVYHSAGCRDPEEIRSQKEQILTNLRHEYHRARAGWSEGANYDGWFAGPINNAKLNDVDTYYRLVPAFHGLLQQHAGHLAEFYEAVRNLSKLSRTERHLHLNRVLSIGAGPGEGAP